MLYMTEHPPDAGLFNSARLIVSASTYLPLILYDVYRLIYNRDPDDPKEEAFKVDGEDGTVLLEKKRSANEPRSIKDIDWTWLRGGLELGLYVFIGSLCQIKGLQETTAARAAFLNQLQTIFVPVITAMFGLEPFNKIVAMSSVIAITGVALLSQDKSPNAAATSVMGDVWELVSALFFSLYVIRIGNFANSCSKNPRLLVGTKIFFQATFSTLYTIITDWTVISHLTSEPFFLQQSQHEMYIAIGVILWTGLMCSAFSGIVQTIGQRGTPASEAALIFATQPLWASGLATVMLGETMGMNGLIGAALILTGTVIASVANPKDPHAGSEAANSAVTLDAQSKNQKPKLDMDASKKQLLAMFGRGKNSE